MLARATLASLSLLTSLAACTDDAPPPPTGDATLAEATPAQLRRIVTGGLGLDGITATFLVGSYVDQVGVACPAVTTAGDTLTVTGGCTTDDGVRIDGAVVGRNVPALFAPPDPSVVTEVTLDGFELDDPAQGRMRFDGSMSWRADDYYAYDLRTVIGGLEAELTARYEVDDTSMAPVGDAQVTVPGVGTAAIAGRWNRTLDGGTFELLGADVLTIDLGAAREDCTPYAIDGVAGELCDE
ncbi:MAG: hypothetical protein R2939_00575 [Kofleriaceae bacterium]